MNPFERITSLFAWVQIMVSPSLIGVVSGGFLALYFKSTWGWIAGGILAIAGILIGIAFAEKARKGKGTVDFVARIRRNPELDEMHKEK